MANNDDEALEEEFNAAIEQMITQATQDMTQHATASAAEKGKIIIERKRQI